jgi:hypothetical protein
MLLGILVALVKIADLATVIPGSDVCRRRFIMLWRR